jgi:hypothetical protein
MVAFVDGGIGDCPKITGCAEINDRVPNLTLRLPGCKRKFHLLMAGSTRADENIGSEYSVRRLENADGECGGAHRR